MGMFFGCLPRWAALAILRMDRFMGSDMMTLMKEIGIGGYGSSN
jgi:hypothetical protein